jgi:hypothetical protein
MIDGDEEAWPRRTYTARRATLRSVVGERHQVTHVTGSRLPPLRADDRAMRAMWQH